jgi:hypothetical protein
MYEKTKDKWLMRASAYETLLLQEGVDEAERYIRRYLNKIDRFLDACWRLHKLKKAERKEMRG